MRRTFESAHFRLLPSGEIDLVLDFRTPLGRARRQTYRFDRGRFADFCYELGVPVSYPIRYSSMKAARKRATAA